MPTFLLALVSYGAYAAGVIAARRMRRTRGSVPAHPYELVLITALFVGIIALRHPHQGFLHSLTWITGAFLMGAVFSAVSLATVPQVAAGTREFEDIGPARGKASLWRRWVAFSRAMVDHQFRILLVASYLLIVAPVGIGFRWLRAEPVPSGEKSTWRMRTDQATIDAARRSF